MIPPRRAGLGCSPTSRDQAVSRTEPRRGVVVGGGHNLINMTSIPADLRLREAGMSYLEMDPFAVRIFADGRRVRLQRSAAATLESIAEVSRDEMAPYRDFVALGDRVLNAILPSIRGTRSLPALASLLGTGGRLGRDGTRGLARDVFGSYESLLNRRLFSDLTRGPLAAFAAHGSVGPTVPGGALFAFWQAAYHRFGQWHAQGGSQGLIDALTSRRRSWAASSAAPPRWVESSPPAAP